MSSAYSFRSLPGAGCDGAFESIDPKKNEVRHCQGSSNQSRIYIILVPHGRPIVEAEQETKRSKTREIWPLGLIWM